MSSFLLEPEERSTDPVLRELSLKMEKGFCTAVHLNPEARQNVISMLISPKEREFFRLSRDGKEWRSGSRSFFTEAGLLLINEAHYENLKVNDQLLYYKRLYESALSVEEAARLLHLEGKLRVRVKNLTHSEKLRIGMARLLIQDPGLFILEEPDQNTDLETKRILLNLLEFLKSQGKTMLTLTGNLESALTFGDQVFRLNERGLNEVNQGSDEQNDDDKRESDEGPGFVFNKIPTKVNEKMILFDPPDIDYIESHEGQSHLYAGGEAYPCVFTLTELEEKLRSFGFFRCHRSYIVNLQKVNQVITWTRNSYSLRLENREKSEIPLSKNKMNELKAMLGLK
ncbi:ABC transporter ATP-binding protein [Alteribacter lacisalsi]|uniref:ABC transporter ATP-binding protein n=1 Tax=Alteribacter lacisalsi TaxID=2045244 RepID=A0A2W0H5A4_9BACI|nr:LytTR family transcriptional regulator DNA-binding domain-containing protein [Alteribacter lacisalsi]PYZ96317.1 ABC transporter ATP-binding protein [Alteribacter lacisalsi]